MPKIVIKTIAVASFITLNVLGGTAWGMWEELDTNTQRRILTTHIKGVYPPVPQLDRYGRLIVQPRLKIVLNKVPHTGEWLNNWPNITLETTCANCKQEIVKEYETVVELRSIAARNNQFVLLQQQNREVEQQNDLLRQQIALLLQNRAPQ